MNMKSIHILPSPEEGKVFTLSKISSFIKSFFSAEPVISNLFEKLESRLWKLAQSKGKKTKKDFIRVSIEVDFIKTFIFSVLIVLTLAALLYKFTSDQSEEGFSRSIVSQMDEKENINVFKLIKINFVKKIIKSTEQEKIVTTVSSDPPADPDKDGVGEGDTPGPDKFGTRKNMGNSIDKMVTK